MTTPALQLAVRQAYDVFRSRSAPGSPLNVCTYCCMPQELEREMRSLPLRELTARHFYEYCTGALGDLVQPAAEVGYLLPRWLELLANGENIHHSVELALDRVGRCPPGSFDTAERAALNRFMLAYFDARLDRTSLLDRSTDPLEILIMADVGGCAVQPLLQHWQEHPGPGSTIQLVQSTYWSFWPEHRLTNAFATDRPHLQTVFRNWLLSPDTKKAFAAKMLQPDFQALVDEHPRSYVVPFPLMVDAVFDHLTYDQ